MAQAATPAKDDAGFDHNCYHEEMVEIVKNGGKVIIEVRRPDEIEATGMMNGAHHIPLDDLKAALDLPSDKFEEKYGFKQPTPDGADIVFTCNSGRRSTRALKVGQEFGLTKARHYPGGWQSWMEKTKE